VVELCSELLVFGGGVDGKGTSSELLAGQGSDETWGRACLTGNKAPTK
jgi:hypothetical protein